MTASVFLSCPTPYLKVQQTFIDRLKADLEGRCLLPRTVGVTDFDMRAPLSSIRSLMLDCNGLIAIAFRRHQIKEGTEKPISDTGAKSNDISGKWFTTPWCQIEPAMAFQIGLPVLIFREKGVLDEGILQKGVFGTYMPEFDLPEYNLFKMCASKERESQERESKAHIDKYFASDEYKQIIKSWESKVWQVVGRKGNPRKLYDE